jgi:hypothetical protein
MEWRARNRAIRKRQPFGAWDADSDPEEKEPPVLYGRPDLPASDQSYQHQTHAQKPG